MSASAQYRFYMLVGVVVASHAAYWFIGGRSIGASDLRSVAVVGQLGIGLALSGWAWRRERGLVRTPPVSDE
jgi:hypothetical protein